MAGAHVNFYGRTQANGMRFDFYQPGFNTDNPATDTSIYCNEMWFKSSCLAAIMSVLMAHERIPANNGGVAMVEGAVLGVCYDAVANGAFMRKDAIREDQVVALRRMSASRGVPELYDRIVTGLTTSGFYVDTVLSFDSAKGEYFIRYWVYYGTGDSIRFVKGNDVLVK